MLLLLVPASATNYYVRTGGLDSHAGTSNTDGAAWQTVQKCASTIVAGDTCHVQGGTYNINQGAVYPGATVASLNSNTNGTLASHIAYISEPLGAAKLVFGNVTFTGWQVLGDYTDVTGFDITGNPKVGLRLAGSHQRAISNIIHDIVAACDSNGGAGLNSNNYTASDNDLIGNTVGPVTMPVGCASDSGPSIYVSNLRARVFNNIAFGGRVGIQGWHAANQLTISGNTVFANRVIGITVGAGDSPGGVTCDNSTVTDNIVYNNGTVGLQEHGLTGSGNRFLNNLVFGHTTNYQFLTGTSSNNVTAAPQFVNYQANGSGDYHLSSTSPAINTGTATGSLTYDFANTPRPSGGGYDIGALEYLPAGSAISYVQSRTTTVASTTTPSLAYSSNLGLNNSSFVLIGLNSATATVTSVTDTQGLTYTNAVGPITNGSERVYIFYANTTQSGADTVTVNISAAVITHITVAEYSSSGSNFSLQSTVNGTGTSTSAATSASITTTVANSLLLAYSDTATAPGGAAVAFVRKATNTDSTGTSIGVTIVAPAAGNALVAVVAGDKSVTAITGGGVTWVQGVHVCVHTCLDIWYGLNSSGSGTNVTATLSGTIAVGMMINVQEYSGVATASAADGTITANGTATTSFTTGTITPTQDGDLLVAAAGNGGNGGALSAGPTNGFTALNSQSLGGKFLVSAYRIQSTAASTSAGWTWSTSTAYDGGAIALKAAAGGAGGAGTVSAGSGYAPRQTGGADVLGTTVWSADTETGTLSQYDHESDSGNCTRPVNGTSTTFAHGGTYSTKMTIDTSVESGCRNFESIESNTGNPYYYGAWYYIPVSTTVTGGFWNIFQFKSVTATANDPVWVVNIGPNGSGGLKLRLSWIGDIPGPHAGDPTGFVGYTQSLVNVPIATWFHVEAYLKQSSSFNGHFSLWQDGILLWDFDQVNSNYVSGVQTWSTNNYSDGLSPSPNTIYTDDATIISKSTSFTYVAEDQILTAVTTSNATAAYSTSVPWAIAMGAFYASPTAPPPPPPPPPPPSVPPTPPGNTTSPCPN